MKLVERALENYIKQNSSDEDTILKELDRETNIYSLQPRMLSGHIQGLILKMIVAMAKPKNILEIGTFTGYSAIAMASALEEGATLHTIDINDEIGDIPKRFFEKSEYGDKIIQHIGSALDVTPTLNEVFDIVFIDGDKREYIEYYDMLFNCGAIKKGSILLADNVLWDGKVIDESPKNLKDTYTQGIIKFNKYVKDDPRVEVVIMPFRDGMSIIRVL
ncbi:MAG: class I SAM-dependent methyltransferase [Bacteroidetes bacterium]|nr:class I SAM-dependent methyltransferase [Bacteroidota bacterium]